MTLPGGLKDLFQGVKGARPFRASTPAHSPDVIRSGSLLPGVETQLPAGPPRTFPEPLFPPERMPLPPVAIVVPDRQSSKDLSWEEVKLYAESEGYSPEKLSGPDEMGQFDPAQLERIKEVREIVLGKFPRLKSEQLRATVRKEVHGYLTFQHNLGSGQLKPPADKEEQKFWRQKVEDYKTDSALYFKTLYRFGLLTDQQTRLLFKETDIPNWIVSPPLPQEEKPPGLAENLVNERMEHYQSAAADPAEARMAIPRIFKETGLTIEDLGSEREKETQKAWGLLQGIFPSLFADSAKMINRRALLQSWEVLIDKEFVHPEKQARAFYTRPEIRRRNNLIKLRYSLERIRLLGKGYMPPTLRMLANSAYTEENFALLHQGIIPQIFSPVRPAGMTAEMHRMFGRVYQPEQLLTFARRILRNEKVFKGAVLAAYVTAALGMTAAVGGVIGRINSALNLPQYHSSQEMAKGILNQFVMGTNYATVAVLNWVAPVPKVDLKDIQPEETTARPTAESHLESVHQEPVLAIGLHNLVGKWLLPQGTPKIISCDGRPCRLNTSSANVFDPVNWAVYERTDNLGQPVYYDHAGRRLESRFYTVKTYGQQNIDRVEKLTRVEVSPVTWSAPDVITGRDISGKDIVISSQPPEGFPEFPMSEVTIWYGGVQHRFTPNAFRYMVDSQNPNAYWVMGTFPQKDGNFALARFAYFDRKAGLIQLSQDPTLKDPKHPEDFLWTGADVRSNNLNTVPVFQFDYYWTREGPGSMELKPRGVAVYQDDAKNPVVIAEPVAGTNLFRVPAGKDGTAPITIYQRRLPAPQEELAQTARLEKLWKAGKQDEADAAQKQWENQYRVKTVVDLVDVWFNKDGTVAGWGISKSGMGPEVLVSQNDQAPIGEPREIAHVPGRMIMGSIQTPSRIIEASFAVGAVKTVVGNPLEIILAPNEMMPAPVLRKVPGQSEYYYLYPDARNKETVDVYLVFKGQGPNLTVRKATDLEKAGILTGSLASK